MRVRVHVSVRVYVGQSAGIVLCAFECLTSGCAIAQKRVVCDKNVLEWKRRRYAQTEAARKRHCVALNHVIARECT